MADEINVGRLVAEIVLEAETEKAKQEVAKSAQDIQKKIKTIEDTTADIRVDVKADTKNVVADVKDATTEMTQYLKNNLNSVIDKEAYTNLLKELYSEVPVEIPVVIQVEETSNEDMLEKIKSRLAEIGLEASEVDKILDNCFNDLGMYSGYEKQLNIIAAKLENQREKLEEVRQEQEKLANTKSTSEKHIAQLEKATQSVTNEEIKLKQLENQFDRLIIAQENYVDKKVTAYQKGVDAAEKATQKEILSAEKLEDKTEKANKNLVGTQVTSSLRAIGNVAPGVSSEIADIIEQFEQLKQAMNASSNGGSASLGKLSIAITAISTVIVAAVNVYKAYIEKQEEARKKAVESAESFSDNSQKLKELSAEYIKLKTQLDVASESYVDVEESQKSLLDIQSQLVEMFGKEAEAIDLVNASIGTQIEKIQELSIEEARNFINKNTSAYQEAAITLNSIDYYTLKTDKKNTALRELFTNELNGASLTKGYKIAFNTAEAEDSLLNLQTRLLKMKESGEITGEIYSELFYQIEEHLLKLDSEAEKIDDAKLLVTEYEKAWDIVNGTIDETSDLLYKAYSNGYESTLQNINAIENLSSAYDTLKNGEQLDTSVLLELCDIYPELARYISETGDLSLENGNKIVESQKKMLVSNISTLNSIKTTLRAKEDLSDNEEALLERVSNSLDIYQAKLNQLNEINVFKAVDLSEFQSVASELSKVYETLSENKQLDIEQTLELLDKYPELATVFSDGTSAIDDQRIAVENLYNAKKQEMLLSLQADKTDIESIINRAKSSIEMMKNFDAGSDTDEKDAVIDKLNNELDKYNSELLVTEAKISAINNLYVDLGNATGGINKKLQEQLNLINHRKAMNDLTYGEEISWLQLLYEKYATNAEERMQLDEMIYTAQQNNIKEQTQAYSDLYNTEIKNLEHLKALDQLSKEQELAWLNTIYSTYVLTAEERMSLEEKIYNVQKDIQDEREQAVKDAMNSELDLLEHEKSMDRLSAEDEIKWLERINAQYEMSVEDRRSMELKLHNAKKAYEEEIQQAQQETLDKAIEALEKRRSTSRITYEEEIKQLREIYNTYKLTAEQQQQVLEQIRSLSSSAKSERSSQFGTLGDGVVEALKNQYQQQRDLEEERINQSIESWQKWEDETVTAIQSQIDALDKLADAQESEKERQEYENKRQATELQLAYEKDDYNRKQLQKELARLDNEENERLAEEQRRKKKEELQAQIDSVKEQSNAQQELLQAELDAVADNYEKLMSSYSLENEAYKMMLSKSQNEIVAFIGSYAPEYELLGQSLGERLYIGLRNKIGNIDYYFKQLDAKRQAYTNQTAAVAHQAVDQFWASRAEYEQKLNSMSTAPNVNLTVNFNELVESPVQVAHKMEQVTQNLVNQLKQ